MSNRAIADVIGVAPDTVDRDVKVTARNQAVDDDRKTVGQDGKARPASRSPILCAVSGNWGKRVV